MWPVGLLRKSGREVLKEVDNMCGRTETWMKEMVRKLGEATGEPGRQARGLFAPILPVELELQSSYLDLLADQPAGSISGIALYDPTSTQNIPKHPNPPARLYLHEPASPRQVLHEIQLGMDLSTISFTGAATDAGIALALDFVFAVVP